MQHLLDFLFELNIFCSDSFKNECSLLQIELNIDRIK